MSTFSARLLCIVVYTDAHVLNLRPVRGRLLNITGAYAGNIIVCILKDFENASLVLLLLTLRIQDISAKKLLN